MTEHVKAWQCIGCGRIEAPQNCVGICEDRRVELVYSFEHENAMAHLDAAQRRSNALAALVRQLPWTCPRGGDWCRSYHALQRDARPILAPLDSTA